jgi:hypothetical protein
MSNHTTITSTTVKSHKNISTYEYIQWARGLKAHADKCAVAFNNLQEIYNKQMNLINGYNND